MDADYLQYYVQNSTDSSVKDTNSDWDAQELEHALLKYLAKATRPFCIFIDAIDEIIPENETHKVLNLIKRFPSSLIKVCISSRREHLFELHFQCYPTLVMQEVTKRDMVDYVNTMIDDCVLQRPNELNIGEIVSSLVHNADGVFLWLVFATASIIKGMNIGDSEDEIYERLNLMPKTLTGLYQDMVDRSSEELALYHPTSAVIFNMALRGNPWSNFYPQDAISIFELMVALDDDILDRNSALDGQHHVEDLKGRCERMVTTLKIKCAGLLEPSISDDFISQYWPQDKPSDALIPYSEMAVDFIHRTVSDFLSDTIEGQNILRGANFSDEEMLVRVFKAGLVRCRIFLRPQHAIHNVKAVLEALDLVRNQLQPATVSSLMSDILKTYQSGFLELGSHYPYTFKIPEEGFLVCAAELGFDEYVVHHLPAGSSADLHSFILFRCCLTAHFRPDDEVTLRQHRLIGHFIRKGFSLDASNRSKIGKTGIITNSEALNAAWFQYMLSAVSWNTNRFSGSLGFPAELVADTCAEFIKVGVSTNETLTAVFKWNSRYKNFDIPITMANLQWHNRRPLSSIRNSLDNFIVLEISAQDLFESVLSRANKHPSIDSESHRRDSAMKALKFGNEQNILVYSVSDVKTSDSLLEGVKVWLKTNFLGLDRDAVYQLQQRISDICYNAIQEAISVSAAGEDLEVFLSQWEKVSPTCDRNLPSIPVRRGMPAAGRAAKATKLSQPLRRSARIAMINNKPLRKLYPR